VPQSIPVDGIFDYCIAQKLLFPRTTAHAKLKSQGLVAARESWVLLCLYAKIWGVENVD
jgi:hypothetical protein